MNMSVVVTSIHHGTNPVNSVVVVDHGHLPEARMGILRTGTDLAFLGRLVIESIRPHGRVVFSCGHAGLVSDAAFGHGLKHLVTPHLKVRSTEAPNIIFPDLTKD